MREKHQFFRSLLSLRWRDAASQLYAFGKLRLLRLLFSQAGVLPLAGAQPIVSFPRGLTRESYDCLL